MRLAIIDDCWMLVIDSFEFLNTFQDSGNQASLNVFTVTEKKKTLTTFSLGTKG